METMSRTLAAWMLAACLPGLGSCTWFHGDSHVFVYSDPAGATILVDGEDSGETTPARLDLGGMLGTDHRITLRKAGYREASDTVYHYTTGYTSKWIDGADTLVVFRFPVFWTAGDFIFPFGVRWQYVPHELMVKLYREDEPAPDGVPDGSPDGPADDPAEQEPR